MSSIKKRGLLGAIGSMTGVFAILALTAAPPARAVSVVRAAGSNDWTAVSSASGDTCGIRAPGRLYCWGSNSNYQLGIGSSNPTGPTKPTEVAGGHADWTKVSAGYADTCGIRADHSLWCWGNNSWGQLGDGSTNSQNAPLRVGTAKDWTSVSVGGGYTTCGIRSPGRLYCWGINTYGQVGDGTTSERHTPTAVGSDSRWVQVIGGDASTCGRLSTGRLYCWGDNAFGELGDGTHTARHRPTQVAGDRTDWAGASSTWAHTCARTTGGRVYCWGNNNTAQLGDGTTDNRSRPKQEISHRTDWVAITAGQTSTCGRLRSGLLRCWGGNTAGQVGDDSTVQRDVPTPVAGNDTDWGSISASGLHVCALTTTGRLFCWGANSVGQLGDGTTTDRYAPEQVYSR